MTIKLDAISLPDDLQWTDRYAWSPVVQTVGYSLTGAIIIQEAAKQAGREITLVGDEESAWAVKSIVDAIKTKADTVNLVMTLDYFGTTYSVMFRRDGKPYEAKPVVPFSNPTNDDYFVLTLSLITV